MFCKVNSNNNKVYLDRATSQYKNCEIIKCPKIYDFKPGAMAFQKDSPYLGLFNYYMRRMREAGVLQRIRKAYQSMPRVCPGLKGRPLGIENCVGAFLVIGMGIGAAIGLFTAEWIFKMSNGTSKKNEQGVESSLEGRQVERVSLNENQTQPTIEPSSELAIEVASIEIVNLE